MRTNRQAIKPRTKAESKKLQVELLQNLTEGIEKHDMLLVAVRLDAKQEATKVMATSLFEGNNQDILHLVHGLKQGTDDLVGSIMSQFMEKMPDEIKEEFVQAMSKGMPPQSFDDPSYA